MTHYTAFTQLMENGRDVRLVLVIDGFQSSAVAQDWLASVMEGYHADEDLFHIAESAGKIH